MINLFVESYCQNCPYFEPVKANMSFRDSIHIEVHCKDMNKCNIIHNQILAELAKRENVPIGFTREIGGN